jgi:pimeloyl-ACP methyl ester carboxylesterase
MASDVIALMDHLNIGKAAIVGWIDGAIIGLDIAMKHPARVSKLFAFAANSDPSAVADIFKSDIFNAFIARDGEGYKRLSPTPGEYSPFVEQIKQMWDTRRNGRRPNWRASRHRPGSSTAIGMRQSSARTPSSWPPASRTRAS